MQTKTATVEQVMKVLGEYSPETLVYAVGVAIEGPIWGASEKDGRVIFFVDEHSKEKK